MPIYAPFICSPEKDFHNRLLIGNDPFYVRAFDFFLPPNLDKRQLTTLAENLTQKCTSLKARFRNQEEPLQVYIYEGRCEAPEFVVMDETDVLPDLESFLAEPQRYIDLIDGPSSRITFFQSKLKTVLRLVCSHFAMDGISIGAMRERIGLLSAGKEVAGCGTGYLDWMIDYYEFAKSERGKNELDYWKKATSVEYTTIPNVLWGASSAHRAQRQTVSLNIPATALYRLRQKFSAGLASRFVDVVSSLLTSELGNLLDCSWLRLNWTTAGRIPLPRRSYRGACGWLANRHPITVPTRGTIQQLANHFRSKLLATPNMGSTFPWVCGVYKEKGLYDELHSPITFNLGPMPANQITYYPCVDCNNPSITVSATSKFRDTLLTMDGLYPFYVTSGGTSNLMIHIATNSIGAQELAVTLLENIAAKLILPVDN